MLDNSHCQRHVRAAPALAPANDGGPGDRVEALISCQGLQCPHGMGIYILILTRE